VRPRGMSAPQLLRVYGPPSRRPGAMFQTSQGDDCAICLCRPCAGDEQMLSCGHSFCTGCIAKYVHVQSTHRACPRCPTCRQPIENAPRPLLPAISRLRAAEARRPSPLQFAEILLIAQTFGNRLPPVLGRPASNSAPPAYLHGELPWSTADVGASSRNAPRATARAASQEVPRSRRVMGLLARLAHRLGIF
jgi:hypothetical protein